MICQHGSVVQPLPGVAHPEAIQDCSGRHGEAYCRRDETGMRWQEDKGEEMKEDGEADHVLTNSHS